MTTTNPTAAPATHSFNRAVSRARKLLAELASGGDLNAPMDGAFFAACRACDRVSDLANGAELRSRDDAATFQETATALRAQIQISHEAGFAARRARNDAELARLDRTIAPLPGTWDHELALMRAGLR